MIVGEIIIGRTSAYGVGGVHGVRREDGEMKFGGRSLYIVTLEYLIRL